jgi:hypothetical protein
MSTRATYQFIGTVTGTHTMYIHHDGYPEYAFHYFQGGHTADSFAEHNDGRAELTESHEVHGDTEYRYTVQNGTLLCQKRVFLETGDKWEIEFLGAVYEFINKYSKKYEKLIKDYEQKNGAN